VCSHGDTSLLASRPRKPVLARGPRVWRGTFLRGLDFDFAGLLCFGDRSIYGSQAIFEVNFQLIGIHSAGERIGTGIRIDPLT